MTGVCTITRNVSNIPPNTTPCPSHIQPSQPEDIPGEDKRLASRVRGAAEGALQAFAPVRGIHQHVRSPCRLSLAAGPPILSSTCGPTSAWCLQILEHATLFGCGINMLLIQRKPCTDIDAWR